MLVFTVNFSTNTQCNLYLLLQIFILYYFPSRSMTSYLIINKKNMFSKFEFIAWLVEKGEVIFHYEERKPRVKKTDDLEEFDFGSKANPLLEKKYIKQKQVSNLRAMEKKRKDMLILELQPTKEPNSLVKLEEDLQTKKETREWDTKQEERNNKPEWYQFNFNNLIINVSQNFTRYYRSAS
jgi:hypothetical protein